MKAALMNQNALPFVAPPGPLASAPVASAANQDMWYMSTDFGLCFCRPIATDYAGAYANLTTPPCLHLAQWEVSFLINATPPLDSRIYGEGNTGNNSALLGIGVNVADARKISILLRDDTGADIINTTFNTLVYTGVWKKVTVARNFGSMSLTVDGVTEIITGFTTAPINVITNTSTIGALKRTEVISDFVGKIANFRKCNQTIIPLNQSSGNNVLDSDGLAIGTLVNPSTAWWGYSWVPWSLLQ